MIQAHSLVSMEAECRRLFDVEHWKLLFHSHSFAIAKCENNNPNQLLGLIVSEMQLLGFS